MNAGATTYRAFLLRVWAPADRSGVRASLTDVTTGEVRTFADLGGLHRWLDGTVGEGTPSAPGGSADRR